MPQRMRCTRCGTPISLLFGEALGFDTERILCTDCIGPVKTPRVTLYGAPDCQELARWSDAPERSLSAHPDQAGASRVQVDIDALRGSDDVW